MICGFCGQGPPTNAAEQIDITGWCFVAGLFSFAPQTNLFLCPECKQILRVGLDWAMEHHHGAGDCTLSDSLACAFAFHVGQYHAGTSFNGQQYNPLQVFSPTFVDPDGWGRSRVGEMDPRNTR